MCGRQECIIKMQNTKYKKNTKYKYKYKKYCSSSRSTQCVGGEGMYHKLPHHYHICNLSFYRMSGLYASGHLFNAWHVLISVNVMNSAK